MSERNRPNTNPRLWVRGRWVWALIGISVLLLTILSLLNVVPFPIRTVQAAGTLQVEVIAGYNLVVDSNVSSPSTYAPRVATVIGKFCNTGDAPLTGVYGYIGNGTTPGTYPVRNSATDPEFQSGQKWNYLYNTGLYFFRHLGPTSDATRYMGTIPAGQCRYQYWSFEYPACENSGGAWQEPPCAAGTDPLWGPSIKPDDDFSLQFVIWGNSDQGSDSATWTMTMRNEISAIANKIKPNPDGQWFNLKSDVVNVGEVITSNGILYEFGNIRQGFDNDGDYLPDYNAWAQPISQIDYDPSCFRLIRTTGVLTITRSGGNPTLIVPFQDSLYFTNLPPDNTGVRGNIHYTFLALKGPCNVALTPYQEVASGYDNEKFNGDYGTGIPGARILEPAVTIAKTSTPGVIALGGMVTYTIPFANTGGASAGLTLASGYGVEMPLVISDTVPNGLQLAAAATYNLNFSPNGGMTIRYSTDSGQTWSTTAPVGRTSTWPNSKIIIQWWMNDPLPASTSGNYVRYWATVPSGYSGTPFIENTACIGLGDAAPFACDTAWNTVQGTGSIGDLVWRDENNDGQQTDETTYGINGVAVSLYWDRNGDGKLDAGDLLLSTQDTRTATNPGYYQFTQLPAANYLVLVDKTDPQIPTGYRLTTPGFYAVTLPSGGSYQTADFGFGPSLSIAKRMVSAGGTCDAYESREVVYTISLTNERPGTGESYGGNCRYYVWSTTGSTANPPKNFTNYTAAFGKPDNVFASGDFAIGGNRWLEGTGFDPNASGTISSVEAVFRIYLSASLTDDRATARLYWGGSQRSTNEFSTSQLNNFVGKANAGYLTWTIPGSSAPGGSWTWDDFAQLTLRFEPTKISNDDGGILYVDAIGFRVTTSGACPATDPNDIMVTVPLTDTYNTTYLQFLSADPPHTSVDTGSGLITWSNVGPIYPGETRIVSVRFLAKAIAGTSSVTVNNVARSTGSRFADGAYANNVRGTASGTICQTGSINGYVYSDPNSSGWNYNPSGGDLPIPGVRVTLYGCYDKTTGDLIPEPAPFPNQNCESSQNNGQWRVVSTQVTNDSGYYEFNGLLNGFYYVQVTSADIPGTVNQTAEANDNQAATGTLPNTTALGHTCGQQGGTCDSIWGDRTANLNTTNFNPINSPGETINGVNFGYNIQAGAYGSVWEDNNGDGDKDPGEGPIGGVTVRLYTSSCGGTLVASTTTDANGRYQFGGLTAGTTYYIAVITSTLPGGASAWTQTGESDGSINNCISFTAQAGALSGSHDFGFRKTGSYTIGDTLYYDWDGDGTQDSNEEGIPNVTVLLYEDANGNGIIDPEDAFIASTSTNGSGYYQFANLPAGSYLVIVDTNDPDFPAGVVETQDPDESGVCTICDSRGLATLGPSNDNVDFGYQPRGTGRIGDTVYRDMNGDGVQAGPTETGIAGITVWLEVDLNNDGTYARVASAVTDSSGKYLFTNLPDGKYRVVVDTSDPDLPTDAYGHPYSPTTPTTTGPIVINGGSTYLDADFGFAPGAAVGDRIWRDDDGDGNQDVDEPGIAGVTVGLYSWVDSNNNGYYDPADALTWVANDTTDSDGLYLFSGLPAGNYVVRVDSGVPSGYTLTGDPDVLQPCNGPGGLCDSASGVALRTGQIDLSRDFGYRPQGVIGDYIWFDNDGDGVQDAGEQGIPYVTVRLCADANCNTVLATTQTDSDGYYAFGNLSGGDYYVQVVSSTLPAGLTPTYDLDGTGTPHVTAVTLPPGGSNLNADFGYRHSGAYAISGHVFFDAGNDGGLYNPAADTPFEDITVYLWRDGVIIGTTTTDAGGYYVFPNLPPGNYIVSADRNAPQLAGMTQNTPAPNPPYHRSVQIVNQDVPDQDFGYYAAIDYGDLPDSYRTLVASQGAGHIIGGPRLGSAITTEPNGQPSSDALGDVGDDGIAFRDGQLWTPGATVNITATVSGANGYLVGWFDWNNDGTFSVDEMVVFGNVVNGVNPLTVKVPQNASTAGYFYMRFRLYDHSTLTAISSAGLARGGEVEDYLHRWQPTAVKLLSFTATAQPGGILVAWETASEVNNLGFHLYRRPVGTQSLARLNEKLIPSEAPDQGEGATYAFLDEQVTPGVAYEYILEDVDLNGTRTPHGPIVARALYSVFLPLVP